MADEMHAEKGGLRYDDLFKIKGISGARLLPDSSYIVCVISIPDRNENTIIEHIGLMNLADNELRLLTEGTSPQWSDDGFTFAYIAEDQGLPGIWLYNIKEDTKQFLAHLYYSDRFVDHYASNNFCWSSDGKAIAYVSADPFIPPVENPVSRECTDLLYKTKGGRGRPGYADERRTHIWLIEVAGKKKRRLFTSSYNEHSISFSPDNSKIAFISNHSGHPDLNQWSDVFSADIATGEVTKISNEEGSAFQPQWSPDGNYIAYLGIKSKISTNDSPAEDTQLYIVPAVGGEAKCLTRFLNRRVEQVSWHPSSDFIYFTAGNSGSTLLYRVSIASHRIEIIISAEGKINEYFISKDGNQLIYIHTDTIHLPDLFLYDFEEERKIRLTNFREDLLNNCTLQPAESFWYKSFDDTEIQGWIIKPANFNTNNRFPLVLVIHGGPHNMFGFEFEDRMQILSANGYGVLFINPRGSHGYGQEFSNGCMKAWGGGDYNDLMKGVDYVIENYQWVDPERLGVTGQSYGGYMTNRIITKTKRFAAAVADGSISNLISFAGTSLYHSLLESEYQGSVYDHLDELWKASPLRDVKNVSTPVLFLHGETDNEVPVSQADEMFVALKKLGIETSLVHYVGEGHGWRPDLKPRSRIDLLRRMVNWFDQYLK
jgi:dipeptidyl aminopeptidase/acylaminoacyl peptidase